MTAEIIDMPMRTTLEIPAAKVLAAATESDLEDVLVIGWCKSGEFFFASSSPDGAELLFLLELAKKQLMDAALAG